jgi:hypothetical protein
MTKFQKILPFVIAVAALLSLYFNYQSYQKSLEDCGCKEDPAPLSHEKNCPGDCSGITVIDPGRVGEYPSGLAY